MLPRLHAVPYTNAVWSARYPELRHLLDEAPAEPRGNCITHNLEWASGSDEIEPSTTALLRSEANVMVRCCCCNCLFQDQVRYKRFLSIYYNDLAGLIE